MADFDGTIEQWRVQAYSDNVHHLSQQKVSYLEAWVRKAVNLRGKVKFFDRLGASEMKRTTIRHGDTEWIDIDKSRRAAFKLNFSWSHPVDEEDQLELITDITSELAIAAAAAVGRRIDQTIIDAISGAAAYDESGSSSIALPAAQKETTGSGNTLAKLVASLRKLYDARVMVTPDQVYYVHSPASLEDLLLVSSPGLVFTSRDYNPAMALMTGQINQYLGMTWIMSTLLPIVSSTNVRGTYLCHRSAIGFAEWTRVKSSIAPRHDKNDLIQVLVKTMHGAVRVEDALVVENQVTE
jgi:hypothetical protein